MRAWALATAVVVALLATSANSQILPVEPCKPTILQVSEPVYLGKALTIHGTCFGDGDGSLVVLGNETQKVDTWTDTLIAVTVLVNDPPDTVTIVRADGESVSASIRMSRANRPSDTSMIVPGRVLVRVKEGTDVGQLATAVDSTESKQLFPERLGTRLGLWWELEVTPGDEVTDIQILAESPNVDWAEPVFLREPDRAPNDVCYLPPLPPECADSGQWGLLKIQAASAWDHTIGATSVSIAVIDTGVDFGHVDLSPKLEYEIDLTGSGLGDGCPITFPGHASRVAGIAAAATNNGEGIAGVSWLSKIRSYKVYDEQGGCYVDDLILSVAIAAAASDGADIINISASLPDPGALLGNIILSAWKGGAVLVAPAGNEGNTVMRYPAANDKVIAVSASGTLDERPTFTTYGSWVDIAAPGVDIVGPVPVNAYSASSGTSYAAPFVSGVAALLASQGLNNCEIVETILDPANVDPISWDGGVGRLNALKAVNGPFVEFDTDCDGYSDTDEGVIGTHPLDACANTTTRNDEADDKWPPDFDDNRVINTTDVIQVLPPVLGSSRDAAGNWTPTDPNTGIPYASDRNDLAPDGVINTSDVIKVLPPTLGSSCVP